MAGAGVDLATMLRVASHASVASLLDAPYRSPTPAGTPAPAAPAAREAPAPLATARHPHQARVHESTAL